MKKTLRILFIPFLLFAVSARAQQITLEILEPIPQVGAHNYYGIKATLDQMLPYAITVNGFIYDEGVPDTDHPFSLTIFPSNLSEQTSISFYETSPVAYAEATVDNLTMTASFAGVNITYDITNNILQFPSLANLNTVLNQLDTNYDYLNDTYDALQDTTLTDDQQDSVDIVNGFNDLQAFSNFENLFPGYSSMRAGLAATEAAWLSSDFEDPDPDTYDLTFDDAENAIFNSSYSFKIGNNLYQLTSGGMYINSVLFAKSPMKREAPAFVNGMLRNDNSNQMYRHAVFIQPGTAESLTTCSTNHTDSEFGIVGSDRYKLKVAINGWGGRTSAKGKVVHYKQKGNGWKRSRAKMAAFIGGYVYDSNCNNANNLTYRDPSSGWKKRKQLKAKATALFQTWKTNSGDLTASFDTKVGHSGNLTLTF